ncbi:TAP42-like family protein [Durotheca rogersii]|uniref:TAP42-like family protein n=1 Tax=Durotheca rogersii TaxID=419775 RepID=UPI002220D60E|nr:TAP42-like family protein [Durotheca rogersii]KAI5868280.1 TAP42-like family protein [Durotheca rogersii]
MTMAEEPRSLKSVFKAAELMRTVIEGARDATLDQYREDLAQALELYQECTRIISNISLFSPNEGLEDISTSDIPYLLVNYHVAELLQKVTAPSPQERKTTLNAAREAYERFLHLLDDYSILSAADRKQFSEYNDHPATFSTFGAADPAGRRNIKIANYKAEKELRAKLNTMRNSPHYLEEGGDEEAIRELYLTNIAFCTHMAFQSLEGINREMEVLARAPVPLVPHAVSVQDDERRRRSSRDDDGYSERLDSSWNTLGSTRGPLLSKEGKPLRPFTLTSSRQELQQGVFRPGHNLPTMSIDEYLEEERRRGNIIEGGGEASMRQPEPDEDDIEKADAETMKAREWDEFKEANPRGSGNTLNRG